MSQKQASTSARGRTDKWKNKGWSTRTKKKIVSCRTNELTGPDWWKNKIVQEQQASTSASLPAEVSSRVGEEGADSGVPASEDFGEVK